MRSALLLLAACSTAVADTPKPDEPETRFERDMVARFHMHQNFGLVKAIERLLIRGKLDDAKRFADAIAMAPDEPAHGPWAAQAATVRERAAALARATTVDDALRKSTQLAAACAACHRENYGSAVFEKPPAVPPDTPTIEARMVRHRWAADRLWEAIVGDADDAWREGLDVLDATPLAIDPQRARYAKELQKAVRAAKNAKTPVANRPELYGNILVVCARCHTSAKP